MKTKNANQQNLNEQIGGGIAGIGQGVGQFMQKRNQAQAQSQFGNALDQLSAPVQGPETQEGAPPQRMPPNFGSLYALAGRAFPKQAGEIMPGIVKEFGRGADSKWQTTQDNLEKQYRTSLQRGLSNKSGGLGLQDAKVNQAIDLRTMINQYYDPKTGDFNIPPSIHSELVLGLARLVSPTGQVGVDMENLLRQKTAREGVANALIFLGLADPSKVGGPTQDVNKLFIDSIDRQGQTSEKLRDKYMDTLHKQSPFRLDEARRTHLDKEEFGSSFNDLLQSSPSYKAAKKAAAAAANGSPRAPFKNPNAKKADFRFDPSSGELVPVQ